MRSGIKLLEEVEGDGEVVVRGDIVEIEYEIRLNHGELVEPTTRRRIRVGDREIIAGLRYGLEGMRVGGRRRFRASSHVCYGDKGVPGKIPADAALVFDARILKK